MDIWVGKSLDLLDLFREQVGFMLSNLLVKTYLQRRNPLALHSAVTA